MVNLLSPLPAPERLYLCEDPATAEHLDEAPTFTILRMALAELTLLENAHGVTHEYRARIALEELLEAWAETQSELFVSRKRPNM